jgi:DNA polymerase III epsilon subunit-like protein
MTKQTSAPKRKHSPAATSKPWLVFDTETTGIWHKHEPVGVVQVAAILFDENGNEIEEFISLVHPERSIPLDASSIHGIRDKDVKNAPSRREVAKRCDHCSRELGLLLRITLHLMLMQRTGLGLATNLGFAPWA